MRWEQSVRRENRSLDGSARSAILVVVLGALALVLIAPGFTAASSNPGQRLVASSPLTTPPSVPQATGESAPGVGTVSSSSAPAAGNAPSLQLSVSASPSAICTLELTSCPAGVGVSRVTLTAAAPLSSFETWPAVQVAFVLETTVYDGDYSPGAGEPGYDQCADANGAQGPACEESNGVPFFVANAQTIANAIQAANPHSLVQFALVDYFATQDIMDDPDGALYHVDIPRFVPASQFGVAVQSTFGAELQSGYLSPASGDSDFANNFLHSSSITALYGAIVGSGLNWSAHTHHVIVWIGSTAPKAPGYSQDYCVSPSQEYPPGSTGRPCFTPTCQPSYDYGDFVSPACEGWVTSQDGNASHTIAGLAHTAAQCTDSIGGVCTIDMIDLWDTATDPESPGWPAADATPALGGGPGGPMVEQNTARVLLAGCALSAATGGTWDGPSFFTCPNGQAGTLQPTFQGPLSSPNLQNPSLLAALRGIGFGPVTNSLVAAGTSHPLFSFVPFGNIVVLPGAQAQFKTACLLGTGADSPHCPVQPEITTVAIGPGLSASVYSWNWSTVPSQNQMFAGDTWIASFWVMADGPPYGQVPVDACTTSYCALGGSRALGGYYTVATYLPVTNSSVVKESFPLGLLDVESPPSAAPPPSLPPPVTSFPPPAIVAPAPLPILSPIGLGTSVGIASLSVQAAAAGFIAAGFTALTVKNRPMSIAVAALAGKQKRVRSAFDEGTSGKDSGIGHFE